MNGHILPGPRGNPGNGPAGWQLDKHRAPHEGWMESAQERCSVRSTPEQWKDFLCVTASQPQASSCMCLALGQSQLCLGSVWGKADSGPLQSSQGFRIAVTIFFLEREIVLHTLAACSFAEIDSYKSCFSSLISGTVIGFLGMYEMDIFVHPRNTSHNVVERWASC